MAGIKDRMTNRVTAEVIGRAVNGTQVLGPSIAFVPGAKVYYRRGPELTAGCRIREAVRPARGEYVGGRTHAVDRDLQRWVGEFCWGHKGRSLAF